MTDQNKMNMLLSNKVAVIYGAGGAIGGAAARAFSREGARVYLAGRSKGKLERVATELRSNGRAAETTVVDALNEQAVDAFVDAVVEQAGGLDISMNVIGYGDVQQPLMEISFILQKETLLNRTATLADVGNVATFLASDLARTMTSTKVNISCSALID